MVEKCPKTAKNSKKKRQKNGQKTVKIVQKVIKRAKSVLKWPKVAKNGKNDQKSPNGQKNACIALRRSASASSGVLGSHANVVPKM